MDRDSIIKQAGDARNLAKLFVGCAHLFAQYADQLEESANLPIYIFKGSANPTTQKTRPKSRKIAEERQKAAETKQQEKAFKSSVNSPRKPSLNVNVADNPTAMEVDEEHPRESPLFKELAGAFLASSFANSAAFEDSSYYVSARSTPVKDIHQVTEPFSWKKRSNVEHTTKDEKVTKSSKPLEKEFDETLDLTKEPSQSIESANLEAQLKTSFDSACVIEEVEIIEKVARKNSYSGVTKSPIIENVKKKAKINIKHTFDAFQLVQIRDKLPAYASYIETIESNKNYDKLSYQAIKKYKKNDVQRAFLYSLAYFHALDIHDEVFEDLPQCVYIFIQCSIKLGILVELESMCETIYTLLKNSHNKKKLTRLSKDLVLFEDPKLKVNGSLDVDALLGSLQKDIDSVQKLIEFEHSLIQEKKYILESVDDVFLKLKVNVRNYHNIDEFFLSYGLENIFVTHFAAEQRRTIIYNNYRVLKKYAIYCTPLLLTLSYIAQADRKAALAQEIFTELQTNTEFYHTLGISQFNSTAVLEQTLINALYIHNLESLQVILDKAAKLFSSANSYNIEWYTKEQAQKNKKPLRYAEIYKPANKEIKTVINQFRQLLKDFKQLREMRLESKAAGLQNAYTKSVMKLTSILNNSDIKSSPLLMARILKNRAQSIKDNKKPWNILRDYVLAVKIDFDSDELLLNFARELAKHKLFFEVISLLSFVKENNPDIRSVKENEEFLQQAIEGCLTFRKLLISELSDNQVMEFKVGENIRDEDVLKKRYNLLARKYHPDRAASSKIESLINISFLEIYRHTTTAKPILDELNRKIANEQFKRLKESLDRLTVLAKSSHFDARAAHRYTNISSNPYDNAFSSTFSFFNPSFFNKK